MALTIGGGPLDRPRSGTYNFDLDEAAPGPILYLDKVLKRVRGIIAGQTILDTRNAKILHETGQFIQLYIPSGDVLIDLLKRSADETDDRVKGRRTSYAIVVAGREVPDAAWSFEKPPLAGLLAFDFDKLDEWLEEDDPIRGHPRDPFHRFDCRHSSDRVEVRVGGQLVAESTRTIKLFETGVVARYYFPLADVLSGALAVSPTRGYCPYKGDEAYYHVSGGGLTLEDSAWTITEPLGEALPLIGFVCFWRDPIEITVNGVRADA